jgi:shikimate kinase
MPEARAGPPERVIVLIGPPGAGKSRVGANLARRLNWPFLDTDDLLAAGAGMSVAEIFARLGEARFREWERAAVRDAIGGGAPRVVSVGGGAVLDPGSADLIAGAYGIFLDVSASTALRRLGRSEIRPLLAGAPEERWRELMDQRRAIYTWLARHTIHTDGRAPTAIAKQIAKLLAEPNQGKGPSA